LLRLGGTSVLTDPMLRQWLGPLHRQGPTPSRALPRAADLVLISHLHRDHLDIGSLRRLPPETPLVVPRGAARWAAKGGAQVIHQISVGERLSLAGLELTAVRAAHDGHRDLSRGGPVEPVGYHISTGDFAAYFAGDTDLFAEMKDLGPLDLALLPVWGWGPRVGKGHLDPERAARALAMIRPRLAVPIHWGTLFPVGLRRLKPEFLTEPPLLFASLARRYAPEVEVRVLEPGDETSLEPR
jgi:L-ascorbate metabolism protein UlaG (beta-lactamase superfamily)